RPSSRADPLADGESAAEPVFPHAEPVVHLAVDDHDGHVLRPLREQLRVLGDVLLAPTDAEVRGDARDRSACVLAQVAPGLAQHHHTNRRLGHSWRSLPFATLPVCECGSSVTISTDVGHLKRASRVAAYSM